MKIKKGDTVSMLIGKDKGRTGKVITVMPRISRLVVEGLNILKKHRRARRQGEKGQVIEFPRSVPVSAVALLCPQCGKATRVGSSISSGGTRSRRCAKCNATFT